VSESFEERLAELRTRFRERAVVDTATIEGAAEELSAGAATPDLATELRQIAHRLAGAGGTFGYLEISERASELEALLIAEQDGPEVVESCRALVSEIRKAA
jgi:HPt (histidine-containing phosphotransfer) domain-containing protein